MATYTIETMFLVTGLNQDGNEVGASGFQKEEALARFYKQFGSDFNGVITILELITTTGNQFSIEYIYPTMPNLSLNTDEDESCQCVKTSCDKCNIELPDYSAQGFYIPNDFEYIEELRDAPDTALIEEQLHYISTHSTNTFRQQLLIEGLR